MHKINLRTESAPLESVEMTFTPQAFAALFALCQAGVASGHPLNTSVQDAFQDLPLDTQQRMRAASDASDIKVEKWLPLVYGNDVW